MLRTKLVTIQGRPVLLARPQSNQYGHLALEMQVAISRARQLGTDIYFLRDRQAVGAALYDLDSSDLRILRPTAANRARVLRHTVVDWPAEARIQRHAVIDAVKREIASSIDPHIARTELSLPVRRSLRRTRLRLSEDRPEPPLRPEEQMFAEEAYSGRRRLHEPLRMFIRDDFVEPTTRLAEEIGIGPGMKLVCLHAREGGFKAGREAENRGSRRFDSTRNAHIDTYFDAMDLLVSRGYTVVRIGDPSMTPVQRPGVIDLATHPKRTGMIELFCLLRSHFLMCSESGPFNVAYLTNTPMAIVNATCVIAGYPVRRDGFVMTKKIIDRGTGKQLDLRGLMTEHFLSGVRDITRFHYEDNTPGEITAAAAEMLTFLEGNYEETAAQAEVRALATDTSVRLRPQLQYVRKHGPDRGFLGDGRVFRFVVDKLF